MPRDNPNDIRTVKKLLRKKELGINQSKEEFEESEKQARKKSRKETEDLLANVDQTIGVVKFGLMEFEFDNINVSNKKNVKAKNGFCGVVKNKTRFTVGEGNKKEFVSRKSVNVFDVRF